MKEMRVHKTEVSANKHTQTIMMNKLLRLKKIEYIRTRGSIFALSPALLSNFQIDQLVRARGANLPFV